MTCWAFECFPAFCTASRQQKYSAASTATSYLPTWCVATSTGTGLAASAASRAGPKPLLGQ